MTDRESDASTKDRRPGHGPGARPRGRGDALRRYTDQDQLKPQGGYPADRRPTDPGAIERSDLAERDKQYGSDDN